MRFRIYAGMGGGYGGANFLGVFDFNSESEASDYAYEQAIEAYESEEGVHGIMSLANCREEYIRQNFDNIEDEDGNDIVDFDTFELTEEQEDQVADDYQNEIDSWIDYFVAECDYDCEDCQDEGECGDSTYDPGVEDDDYDDEMEEDE